MGPNVGTRLRIPWKTPYVEPSSPLIRILCNPYLIPLERVLTMAHMNPEVSLSGSYITVPEAVLEREVEDFHDSPRLLLPGLLLQGSIFHKVSTVSA